MNSPAYAAYSVWQKQTAAHIPAISMFWANIAWAIITKTASRIFSHRKLPGTLFRNQQNMRKNADTANGTPFAGTDAEGTASVTKKTGLYKNYFCESYRMLFRRMCRTPERNRKICCVSEPKVGESLLYFCTNRTAALPYWQALSCSLLTMRLSEIIQTLTAFPFSALPAISSDAESLFPLFSVPGKKFLSFVKSIHFCRPHAPFLPLFLCTFMINQEIWLIKKFLRILHQKRAKLHFHSFALFGIHT